VLFQSAIAIVAPTRIKSSIASVLLKALGLRAISCEDD
jgi:hypothetical protein